MGIGGVFGRDAGIGFGPRLQWRNGYTNPARQLALHWVGDHAARGESGVFVR